MGRVELNGLYFKAYHGYYEEEREHGNHFEVAISVTTDFEEAAEQDDLDKAVNYEMLYDIVKKEMQISSALLETVVVRITNKVLEEIQQVKSVSISLSKLNPPIQGVCREAKVTFEKRRS